jgi:hypothetical protein
VVDAVVSERPEGEGPALLVGAWDALRREPAVEPIAAGPAHSGVFARFERQGESWELSLLDQAADEGERLGSGAGLVAATERNGAPLWLVAGADERGATEAAAALDPAALRHRFAIAVEPGGETVPVPFR